MISSAVCDSYKLEILQGIHLAADDYYIALYTSAASLDKATTAYSATNEVVGAGYAGGGQLLSGFIVTQSGDTAQLTFSDAIWANATITGAAGCLIYNSSRSNKAVCAIAFSVPLNSTAGTATVTMPAALVSIT